MEPHDLFVLLCGFMRWALSRNDGSMLTFENMIRKYGHRITAENRQQLISEIAERIGPDCLVFGDIETRKGWESIAKQLATSERPTEGPTAEEAENLRNDRTLDCIRSLRMRTNLGLREAKDVVELWRSDRKKYDW